MDIDDDLDVFGEGSKKVTKLKLDEWVFPIIGRKFGENTIASFGTGFFINNDGYFITAGHVLRDNENSYKVLFKENEYDFRIMPYDNEINESLICVDFAIGMITNLWHKVKVECCFTESYNCGEILSFAGYSLNKIWGCLIQTISIEAHELHLLSPQAKNEKVLEPTRKVKIVGGDEIVDKRPMCKNVFSLVFNKDFPGLSGGPVFKGKNIYGMLIGREYILSDYIVEKLEQLKIPYNK